MKLENILGKEELEQIKKIGEIAIKLKLNIHENKELNVEAQKILMGLVDEDADELIRDIINDTFVDYMSKAIERKQ